MIESSTKTIDDWVIRVREPAGKGPHPVLLLLHGWTGDENSMWIFTSRLPNDFYLIAPRGQYFSPLGGYSWQTNREKPWPSIDEFRPSVDALLKLLTPANFPSGDFSKFRLAGFSQGAALVYAFGLLQPQRVISFAGLSGFFPDGAGELVKIKPLQGKPAFVAHGTLDDLVPIDRARQAVVMLEEAGAQVTFCEDNVGHKLSAACFRGLESFLKSN